MKATSGHSYMAAYNSMIYCLLTRSISKVQFKKELNAKKQVAIIHSYKAAVIDSIYCIKTNLK